MGWRFSREAAGLVTTATSWAARPGEVDAVFSIRITQNFCLELFKTGGDTDRWAPEVNHGDRRPWHFPVWPGRCELTAPAPVSVCFWDSSARRA